MRQGKKKESEMQDTDKVTDISLPRCNPSKAPYYYLYWEHFKIIDSD